MKRENPDNPFELEAPTVPDPLGIEPTGWLGRLSVGYPEGATVFRGNLTIVDKHLRAQDRHPLVNLDDEHTLSAMYDLKGTTVPEVQKDAIVVATEVLKELKMGKDDVTSHIIIPETGIERPF